MPPGPFQEEYSECAFPFYLFSHSFLGEWRREGMTLGASERQRVSLTEALVLATPGENTHVVQIGDSLVFCCYSNQPCSERLLSPRDF